VIVQAGAVKIYVAAVERSGKRKKQDEIQLTTKIRLMEKLVWVPVISFWKLFIPS
jgi:hypothetical protein